MCIRDRYITRCKIEILSGYIINSGGFDKEETTYEGTFRVSNYRGNNEQHMYSTINFGGSSGAIVFRNDANGNKSTSNAGAHSHNISGNTNNVSAHAHNVSISGNIASQGVSGTDKNLPPYYALCYIMKS